MQILRQRQIKRDLRRRSGYASVSTRQAAPAQGANKLRTDIANEEGAVKADVVAVAPGCDDPRCDQRQLASELPAQIAAAVQCRADVAQDAKRLVRESGVTLRDLVVTGLRAEVARRRSAPRIDFVFPTIGGNGLVADLAPGEVIDRSYGFAAAAGSSR